MDLVDGKFPVPDVEVGQLADVGLRRIEPSTQCVLPKKCRWKSQSSATQSTCNNTFLEKKILDTFVSLVLARRKNSKTLKYVNDEQGSMLMYVTNSLHMLDQCSY